MPGLRRIVTAGTHPGQGGTLVGLGIDIQGLPEIQQALAGLSGPQMAEVLQKATRAGAFVFRRGIRAEVPPSQTGKLKKSISARKARGFERGYVVSPRPKIAFYRHMVIKGTKAHRIRFPNQRRRYVLKQFGNIRHPGAKADPFVARGFEASKEAASKATVKSIEKYLAKVWSA